MTSNGSSCGTSGPIREPILQIHPSLWCNLQCKHCYSESNPWTRTQLDPELVCQTISDAAAMGYKVVSVSGGEPFLYKGLSAVLRHAKALGLRTTVTTNGYLLKQDRLAELSGLLDLLAVSVDGPPDVHNEVRGSSQAFAKMQAGVENARTAGLKFGFIHTATPRSWEHLLWLGEFAHTNGAQLLQIHPLELAGRARSEMQALSPDHGVITRIYLLAFALGAKYGKSMRVQCDLMHRDHAIAEPELIYASDVCAFGKHASELLSIIVLEPDGAVVPVSFGFDRKYQICNVKEERLTSGWQAFAENRYSSFRGLCREVYDEVSRPGSSDLFNWHELVVTKSHESSQSDRGNLVTLSAAS